jgi:hypothetical protein
MNINLPEPIENYFRYSAEENPKEAAAAFTPDATIFDKGEDLEVSGREAIYRWFTELTAKYKTTVEVVNLVEEEGEFVATTLVSGNFDGSPAEFVYRFVIRDGLIDRLVIDFIGFK